MGRNQRGAALLAALFLLTSGCDVLNRGWREGQEDVAKAKIGWTLNDVMTKIGKPSHIIEYEGVRTGLEEWVYPTGSIFMYRMIVKEIVTRPEGAPMPKPPRDKWDLGPRRTEPKGFHDF